MKNEKLGQEPAFPLDGMYAADALRSNNTGMSKRFYAACMEMQGYLANPKIVGLSPVSIIEDCYQLADELLKQENE